jgi:hypothetical protein
VILLAIHIRWTHLGSEQKANEDTTTRRKLNSRNGAVVKAKITPSMKERQSLVSSFFHFRYDLSLVLFLY